MVTYHTPKDCFAAALDIFGSSISPLALTTFDAQASSRMRLRDGGGSWFLAVRLGGRPLTIERQIDECRVACEAYRPLVVEILEQILSCLDVECPAHGSSEASISGSVPPYW